MSDKLKVYQGVRVKTTVKELLQRHREKEANNKKLNAQIHQACLELQELRASTFQSGHVTPPPSVPPAEAGCGSLALQLRATISFPVPDSGCNIQMQESAFNGIQVQQQFGDVMLPGNGYSGTTYDTPLPPLPTSPQLWFHGLSSDADYYGQGMAPCSSLESLTFCNSVDPNSYSPQDSFSSSSSSSCYDSPTRMESSYCGFSPQQYHYQYCGPQDYYSLPHCWSSQQESPPTPYFAPTDYPQVYPVEDDCFRKDFPLSSEMSYNAL